MSDNRVYSILIFRPMVFILLFAVTLLSCTREEFDTKGFSELPSGVLFKLHKIGELTDKPESGNYVKIDVAYSVSNDSVFYSGTREFALGKSVNNNDLSYCIKQLAEGDSASFIINTNNLFSEKNGMHAIDFLRDKPKVKIDIALRKISSEEEYNNQRTEFLSWIDNPEIYEKEQIKEYIKQNKLNMQISGSGMYYCKIKEGNGKKPVSGDILSLNYEGQMINGKYFDSTKKRREYFSYKYGVQYQVIKGFEEAVSRMTEGEKVMIILPSWLAFGKEGSATGIIPPFTSVIYELELVKINKQ